MVDMEQYIIDIKDSVSSAIDVYKKELDGIRAGRVSQSFLNPVVVRVYGTNMPIAQVANVNVQDGRMIIVQVWDVDNVVAVQKAIVAAELGVSPTVEGSTIRIIVPPMTEERRDNLIKATRKCAERAKVAVRNIRRNILDALKRNAKSEGISDDDKQKITDKIQKVVDGKILSIDEMLSVKEKDILDV